MNALPKPCHQLIFLNSLFQGGRLFVGAIGALYFLSFGFEPKDFIWVKSLQAVIFITLDIPLGFLMNRIGDYKSLLLALLMGLLGALGYLFARSLTGFMLSESLLALSLSIWPVALSSYSMRSIKEKEEGLIEKFFHKGDAISNLTIVVCGSIGALAYGWNRMAPYSLFALVYLFGAIYLFSTLRDLGPAEKQTYKKSSLPTLHTLRPLLPFALILFSVQLILQPLLHYWQPFFVENFKASSKDMSLIFVSYSLTMSALSFLYSKFTRVAALRSHRFPFYAALIGGGLFLALSWTSHYYAAILLFSLLYALLNLTQVSGSVHIQKGLQDDERLVTTKFISFVGRIGMVCSFGLIHYLLSGEGKIQTLYTVYGIIGVILFLSLLFITKPKQEEEIVFQS